MIQALPDYLLCVNFKAVGLHYSHGDSMVAKYCQSIR